MNPTPDLWQLRNSLNEQGILLCFNGPLSRSIIEEMGVAVRGYLESEAMAKGQVGDIFSVYIEQVQNIRQYAARRATDPADLQRLNAAIVTIRRRDEQYTVSAGNLVEHPDVPELEERLRLLENLDAAGLKKLYKETLKKPRTGGGAGLGLINMARTLRRPLAFSFQPIDQRFVFFALSAEL